MATLFLEYPRLTAALVVPDAIAAQCRANFAPVLSPATPPAVHSRFDVALEGDAFRLVEDDAPCGTFPDATQILFFVEEEIERAVLRRLGNWLGLHAGAAALGDGAIIVAGHPDTGKTTTTFQLIELGLEHVCEEVTAIDPHTLDVHPFPHPLTLSRSYTEQFAARYALVHGALEYYGPDIARYVPARVRTTAVRARAIVFPAFNPRFEPRVEEVAPARVLTDLLQYCFEPSFGEEQLFDAVIRLVEHCRLFTMQTCSVESSRMLVADLIADLAAVK